MACPALPVLRCCVTESSPPRNACFHTQTTLNAARLDGCLRATRELVARDKNHPSVIMWSWANEPEANTHIATHGTQARRSACCRAALTVLPPPLTPHMFRNFSRSGVLSDRTVYISSESSLSPPSPPLPRKAGASGGGVAGQGARLLRGSLRRGAAARPDAAAHPGGASAERRELDRAVRRRVHKQARAPPVVSAAHRS